MVGGEERRGEEGGMFLCGQAPLIDCSLCLKSARWGSINMRFSGRTFFRHCERGGKGKRATRPGITVLGRVRLVH